jgi:ATP-dependent RNA helicase DeaD
MLEQTTRQPLQLLELPSDEALQARRNDRFRQGLAERLGHVDSANWHALADELRKELGQTVTDFASGLLALLAEQQGLNAKLPPAPAAAVLGTDRPERSDRGSSERGPRESGPRRERATVPMDSYRLAVGRSQQVKVGDIVGAIANETGIDSAHIGRIQLHDDYSTVDLPRGMPKDLLQRLQTVRVRNHPLAISRVGDEGGGDNVAAVRAERPRPVRSEHRPEREARPRAAPRRESAPASRSKEPRSVDTGPRKKLALKH